MTEGCHTLGCDHKYHAECIIKWFRSGHSDCPMCRGMPNVKITLPTLMQRAHAMINMPNIDPSLRCHVDIVKQLQMELRTLKNEARLAIRTEKIKYGPILQSIKEQREIELQRHARQMAALNTRSKETNKKVKIVTGNYNAKIRIKVRELNKAKKRLGMCNARPIVG